MVRAIGRHYLVAYTLVHAPRMMLLRSTSATAINHAASVAPFMHGVLLVFGRAGMQSARIHKAIMSWLRRGIGSISPTAAAPHPSAHDFGWQVARAAFSRPSVHKFLLATSIKQRRAKRAYSYFARATSFSPAADDGRQRQRRRHLPPD